MYQGDAYPIPFSIKVAGNYVTDYAHKGNHDYYAEVIEVFIGNLRKVYDYNDGDPTGEIEFYDTTDGVPSGYWLFPLSQEETYLLSEKKLPAQARIKFGGSMADMTAAKKINYIDLSESMSKEVI